MHLAPGSVPVATHLLPIVGNFAGRRGVYMKLGINDLALTTEQREAVLEAKNQLMKQFSVEMIVMFGSVARGEDDEHSDLDLLVITGKVMTHGERNSVSDVIFEVNYAFGTNLSVVVVDALAWDSGIYSLGPFHSEVQRDGVVV